MGKPNPPTVPITVVIPSYGNDRSLDETLQRILTCNPLPSEIILFFDGGTSPKVRALQNCPIPYRIYESKERLGPGGCRQKLFDLARTELVASFDDDSWPLDTEYFAQAVAVMNALPNVAVLSPEVYLLDKDPLPQIPEVYSTRSFLGSASIHRVKYHQQIPGYVPVPEAYGVEEVDVSLQLAAAGYDIVSSPWLRAWHGRQRSDNQHTILPWIKNEVLLAYLRYPLPLQPWGWLNALRHIWQHRRTLPLKKLLGGLLTSIPHCAEYKKYQKKYPAKAILRNYTTKALRRKINADEFHPINNPNVEVGSPVEEKKALYIQYFNPGAYPPLEHSSILLAREGWKVIFCGIKNAAIDNLNLSYHPHVSEKNIPAHSPGLRQKLNYLHFIIHCIFVCLRYRPHWIYASDIFAALPARILSKLFQVKTVYHEHDEPLLSANNSVFLKSSNSQRLQLAREAELLVVPNEVRLSKLIDESARKGTSFCVWNVPLLEEVVDLSKLEAKPKNDTVSILYQGSIVPNRFPMTFLDALARSDKRVHLKLIGYETLGSIGYINQLQQKARELGVADRFEYLGAIARKKLMSEISKYDVGFSMLQINDGVVDMSNMVGASNKAFDYLSQGLAIIVPKDEQWENMYVAPEYAVSCDLLDVEGLTQTFNWCYQHQDKIRKMGAKGRAKIISSWNYESQFQPVMEAMDAAVTVLDPVS